MYISKYAATSIFYTLSLHDALPISGRLVQQIRMRPRRHVDFSAANQRAIMDGLRGAASAKDGTSADVFKGFPLDRKSTRLNSSHVEISYAVFCLKKKNYHIDRLIFY